MKDLGAIAVSIKGMRWRSSHTAIDKIAPILPDVTINLQHGKLAAIVGPSGVGKSSLLKAISTWHDDLIIAERNVVDFETNISIMPDKIFYLPQKCEHLIFPWYSVEKNLLISARSRNRKSYKELKPVIIDMAESLGFNINSDLRKRPHQLSGGMSKRLAVAMALLTNPQILILDEPFVGLNPRLRSEIMQVIKRFIKQLNTNKVAIFTSHDMGEVKDLADFILGFRQKARIVEIEGPIVKIVECDSKTSAWDDSVSKVFYEM